MSSVLALHQLEEENFNLLYSLASCGYSLGMILPPLLADFLLGAYGWRGGMLVLGGLMANIIPSTLAIPVRKEAKTSKNNSSGSRPSLAKNRPSDVSGFQRSTEDTSAEYNDAVQRKSDTSGTTDGDADQIIPDIHTAYDSSAQGVIQPDTSSEIGGNKAEKVITDTHESYDEPVQRTPSEATATYYSQFKQINPVPAGDHAALNDEVLGNMLETHTPYGDPEKMKKELDLSGVEHETTSSDRTPLLGGSEVTDASCEDRSLRKRVRFKYPERRVLLSEEDTSSGKDSSTLGSTPTLQRILGSEIQNSDFYLDPCLNCIILASFILGIVYSGWHSFLVPHVIERGVSIHLAIVITTFAAIGNMTGRISAGVLSHRLLRPIVLFLILTIINIAALLCYAYIQSYYIMLVTSLLSAGAIAGRAVLMYLSGRERTTPEKFPITYAAIQVFFGTGNLLGGYMSGITSIFALSDKLFQYVIDVRIIILIVKYFL